MWPVWPVLKKTKPYAAGETKLGSRVPLLRAWRGQVGKRALHGRGNKAGRGRRCPRMRAPRHCSPSPRDRSSVEEMSILNSASGTSSNSPCSKPGEQGDQPWSTHLPAAHAVWGRRAVPAHAPAGRCPRWAAARWAGLTPLCSSSGTSMSARVRKRPSGPWRPATRKLHPWCRSLANCGDRHRRGRSATMAQPQQPGCAQPRPQPIQAGRSAARRSRAYPAPRLLPTDPTTHTHTHTHSAPAAAWPCLCRSTRRAPGARRCRTPPQMRCPGRGRPSA